MRLFSSVILEIMGAGDLVKPHFVSPPAQAPSVTMVTIARSQSKRELCPKTCYLFPSELLLGLILNTE